MSRGRFVLRLLIGLLFLPGVAYQLSQFLRVYIGETLNHGANVFIVAINQLIS